jgi:ABC-type Fe3+-hydroxamate transport system substrate-binding protein
VEAGNRDDPFAVWRPWKFLPAVREQRFVELPVDLLHRPTPRILEGAELLCRGLETVRKR